jgi:hypothetical protein
VYIEDWVFQTRSPLRHVPVEHSLPLVGILAQFLLAAVVVELEERGGLRLGRLLLVSVFVFVRTKFLIVWAEGDLKAAPGVTTRILRVHRCGVAKGRDLLRWPTLYDLARQFQVSITAMKIRLETLGLIYVSEDRQIHPSRVEYLGQGRLFQ